MNVPWGNLSPYSSGNMVHFKETNFKERQFFHPFHSWMKMRIQKKVQIQDIWVIMGIQTIALVFFL
jgi:hypothetical protein